MSNTGPQRNLFDALLRALNYVSVLAIFFTAVWIFADVFGRFFLRSPIPGTTELIKSVLLAIVFFGVPYTLRVDGHIRTSILLRRFSPGLRTAAEIFGAGLGAAIFTLVCIYGWKAAVKAWEVLEFEGVQLRVPTYPSRFIMVLGSALLVVQYLLNIVAALRRAKPEPGTETKHES
jgi:TRAP-type C4-dicarboxylate transport system permease small subunit